MPKTFEEYLEGQCEYEGVLDDDMPDYLDNWISELDGQEIMYFAEKWGHKQYLDGMKKGLQLHKEQQDEVENYAKSIAKTIN